MVYWKYRIRAVKNCSEATIDDAFQSNASEELSGSRKRSIPRFTKRGNCRVSINLVHFVFIYISQASSTLFPFQDQKIKGNETLIWRSGAMCLRPVVHGGVSDARDTKTSLPSDSSFNLSEYHFLCCKLKILVTFNHQPLFNIEKHLNIIIFYHKIIRPNARTVKSNSQGSITSISAFWMS